MILHELRHPLVSSRAHMLWGQGTHLVDYEDLVIDLDAQVVRLDYELILWTLRVSREVRIRVDAILINPLHTHPHQHFPVVR